MHYLLSSHSSKHPNIHTCVYTGIHPFRHSCKILSFHQPIHPQRHLCFVNAHISWRQEYDISEPGHKEGVEGRANRLRLKCISMLCLMPFSGPHMSFSCVQRGCTQLDRLMYKVVLAKCCFISRSQIA